MSLKKKIKISCKLKLINSKIKIHPIILKSKECCICYENIYLKKLVKCENIKCKDGYVCKNCIKKSNNTLQKCPLCRNESDIFLEKKETIVEIPRQFESNLNNTEQVKYYNINKIIKCFFKNKTCVKLCNTLLLLILSFFAGIIVSLLFSQDVTKMNIFIIIFIGIGTIILIIGCAKICCKDLDKH